MKPHSFIKLFLLLASCIALSFLVDNGDFATLSKGREHVSSDFDWTGEYPTSYVVNIEFKDALHHHTHTHTYNDGTYEINVVVKGTTKVMETGNLKQLYGTFKCEVESSQFSGTIEIEKTLTIFGDKSEADLRNDFRDALIKTILKKLENT